ncbi:MAG: M3 family metallopeptidase [Proteobacteria bacterium]|nr:M3 family metallopeptidase [Pseudomonadota bacterium]
METQNLPGHNQRTSGKLFLGELAKYPTAQNTEGKKNPLLTDYDLFPYQRVKPEHIVPAVTWLQTYVEKEIALLEENPASATWENTLGHLEEIGATMARVTYPIYVLYGLDQKDEWRTPFLEAQNMLVPLSLRINQSKKLYQKIQTLMSSSEYQGFSSAQKRALEQYHRTQELSGIHLDGEERDRFLQMKKELSKLSTQFGNNVTDSVKAYSYEITDKSELDGVPDHTMSLLSDSFARQTKKPTTPEKGPWLVTLASHLYSDIMKYCHNHDLRKKMYHDYCSSNYQNEFDNSEIITQILSLRDEIAKILGFTCYADVSLASKMAKDKNNVLNMHRSFLDALAPALEKEKKLITELKLSLSDTKDDLYPWDVNYYIDQYIRTTYDYHPDGIRQYLPLPKVLDGLFQFIENMFGVTLSKKELDDPSLLWHEDVSYYEVIDTTSQRKIATLYLDLYARPGQKNPGAWMHGHKNHRVNVLGQVELAEAHVVCNFSPPIGDQPSLLSFYNLTTLFHEFGHALQQMLSTVNVGSMSGTSGIEWDVVELPSQFLEYWCYQKDLLNTFAQHHKTGETLPDELFQKMMDAKNFGQGHMFTRQVSLGMIDMYLHSHFHQDMDVFAEYAKILAETYPYKADEYANMFLTFFGHIFRGGYASGYYSYLWARLYSADAFGVFDDSGLNNQSKIKELGRKFRDTVLALGGSEDPNDVYFKFCGKKQVSPSALLYYEGLLDSKN